MFSDPVVGDDFFGRQAIIDLLAKRAVALKGGYRQNVALIGHQQLGKTSILRHFLHATRDPEILSIYVEIKLQALDYFVEQFTRALLYQVLIEERPSPMESLKQLAERARPRIPKTVAKIDEIAADLKHRRASEAYAKLFELTSFIKLETGRHCIVILDEFHRLGEFGLKSAFTDFGKRIMVQKDTMYILSSSSFSASRKILAEKLALLFGNFERIYLEPFDFETSFEFIAEKLRPLSVPSSIRHFMVSFTDGHPFFLETLVRRTRELSLAKTEEEVTRQTVAEVLMKVLYESQGVLNQYFMKLISPWTHRQARGTQLLILTELARGTNRLKDIAKALNRSQSEISADIKELMEYEIVLKTGVFYRFHNRIFKFWLKEVYEKKEFSLLGSSGNAKDFLKRIDELISEEETFAGMDIAERVTGLFGQFRNDMIEFGEKKRQLPHFTGIVQSREAAVTGGKTRDLIATGHGRCWVCKIVEEKATEKEVLELVQGVSNKKQEGTRVLVALNGLDENAKLLAKEKRVLTLGLQRLNLLMDIYGKAPVIRTNV